MCRAAIAWKPYPVTPDTPPRPRSDRKSSISGVLEHRRTPDRLPEAGIGQPAERVWYLQPQTARLEPVWLRCMLHHAVGDQVARVDHVLITGLEVDLVDLTTSGQGEQSSAGDERVTPVG